VPDLLAPFSRLSSRDTSSLFSGLFSGSASSGRLLSGKPVRIAVPALVLLAAAGGAVLLNRGHDVTLSVDGSTQHLSTKADTVKALLADQHLAVTDRDIVAPSADSPVRAGEQVVVRFARPLILSVDGAPHTYWTTALTVNEALASLGIRADGARLTASRSQPLGRQGLSLAMITPKAVTLTAAGGTKKVTSTALTVKDLLVEQGLTPGSQDLITPAAGTTVKAGLAVKLQRVSHRMTTLDSAVPAPMTSVSDAAAAKGRITVVRAGVPGTKHVVYDEVYVDGVLHHRTVVSSAVTKVAVAGSQKVGTKVVKVTYSGTSGTGADGLNWSALARCESGGNPRAVNPAGYYGLYQFSLATWRSMGGSGNPINASPSEQLMRAKMLYNKAGAGQWGCGRHLFD
jgi:resuscitation-promoting factor RpfB